MFQLRRAITRTFMPALMAGLVLGTALPAQPARAATWSSAGCTPVLQMPTTRGHNLYAGLTVEMPARTILRAPCNGQTQVVSVVYRFWGGMPGNWVHLGNQRYETRLDPGYQMNVPGYAWTPGYRNISVDVTIEWRTVGGALISWLYTDYNSASDYYCYQCFVRTDPTVGAYLALGW